MSIEFPLGKYCIELLLFHEGDPEFILNMHRHAPTQTQRSKFNIQKEYHTVLRLRC